VRPNQLQNGDAVEFCPHRGVVYERARQLNPRHWSRSTRYWLQPEVIWIYLQADDDDETGKQPLMQEA